jgi:transcriptional regulator with XRE-family HTH domain
MGSRLKQARESRGWSQTRLIQELQRHAAVAGFRVASEASLRTQLSRWENGRPVGDEMYRRLFRTIFGTTDEDLGLTAAPRAPVPAAGVAGADQADPDGRADLSGRADPSGRAEGGQAAPRRDDPLTARLTVAAATALPAALRRDVPGRVDITTVEACWTALHHLYELDARRGGVAGYDLTKGMARRLLHVLTTATYSTATGRRLRGVTAAFAVHAGWQAYDAGQHANARHWWLETLHLCGLGIGAEDSRTAALACMSLQVGHHPNRGREAAELARAAAASAGRDASGLLVSLLSAREAVGTARDGDRYGTAHALGRARARFEEGGNGDEPEWLRFWNTADLACHEMRAALYEGRDADAERAARHALAHADTETMPRNATIYGAYLGGVLTQVGKLDEAIRVTQDAVEWASALQSPRINRHLHMTLDLLGQQPYTPARVFSATARRLVPAA